VLSQSSCGIKGIGEPMTVVNPGRPGRSGARLMVIERADAELEGLVLEAQVVVGGKGGDVLLEVLLGEIQKLGNIGPVMGELPDGVEVVQGEEDKLLVQTESVVGEDAIFQTVWQAERRFNRCGDIPSHGPDLMVRVSGIRP
jgi:hypothetical protein